MFLNSVTPLASRGYKMKSVELLIVSTLVDEFHPRCSHALTRVILQRRIDA